MANGYKVFETSVFLDDLKNLPRAISPKIAAKLKDYVYPQLRQQPHFGPNVKKLRNWNPETWRYRIGPWRFFYEIDESRKVILMTTMDHRKDSY